jgi:hypothetical protein
MQTKPNNMKTDVSEIAPPAHLREEVFRKYEGYIRHGLITQELKIHAPGLAASTVTARLRDAIRSLKLFPWRLDWWTGTREELKVQLEQLTVSSNNETVFLTNLSLQRASQPAELVPPVTVNSEKLVGLREFQMLVELLHLGILEMSSFTFRSDLSFEVLEANIPSTSEITVFRHQSPGHYVLL